MIFRPSLRIATNGRVRLTVRNKEFTKEGEHSSDLLIEGSEARQRRCEHRREIVEYQVSEKRHCSGSEACHSPRTDKSASQPR
jgi:hypothetical protein